jgi:dephospho-CoA kinase
VRRVALTGGIATGKSYCLARFAQLGAAVVDADALARAAVAPGTPGLAAVVARFGEGVLQQDGALDRGRLAVIVFADAQARRDLEGIVHPAVRQAIDEWYRARERNDLSRSRIGIADIPLLYETGRQHDFETVVVAACRPDQQLARLTARDGIDETAAHRRLDAQLPIDEKVRRADFVIDTSGTFAETAAAVDRVWQELRGRSPEEPGSGGIDPSPP